MAAVDGVYDRSLNDQGLLLGGVKTHNTHTLGEMIYLSQAVYTLGSSVAMFFSGGTEQL